MRFDKRIKKRIALYIYYFAVGAAFVALSLTGVIANENFIAFGAMLILLSIIRFVQYSSILKDQQRLDKLEIAETDERNVMISKEARSLAVTIYSALAMTAVFVLMLMGRNETAQIISYNVIVLIVIYVVCCSIFKRKY